MPMDLEAVASPRLTPFCRVPPVLLLTRYLARPVAARLARSDRVTVGAFTLVAETFGAGGGGGGGGGMSGMSGLLKHIVCLLLLSELFCEEADNRTLSGLDPDESIWISQGGALVREEVVKRNH